MRSAGFAVLLLVVGVARVSSAYCVAASCKVESPDGEIVNGSMCVPVEQQDAGYPLVNPPCEVNAKSLHWGRDCIGFALGEPGSVQVSNAKAAELMRAAFATWTSAPCQGGGPRIRVEDLGTVECADVEYNQEGGNVNVVVFRDTLWRHDPNALGKTTLSYEITTGEIYDADIEINSTAGFVLQSEVPAGWMRPPTCDQAPDVAECLQYDLASILTHEAGHFLGLAHSPVSSATMHFTVGLFDTEARSLDPDDVAGICSLYPPGEMSSMCNPIPRHGYSPYCFDDQIEGDCSIGAEHSGGWAWIAVLALIAMGGSVRRICNRCPPPRRAWAFQRRIVTR